MRGFGLLIQLIGALVAGLGSFALFLMGNMTISPAVPFLLGLALILIGGGMQESKDKQTVKQTQQKVEVSDMRGCSVCGSKSFTWGNVASYSAVRYRKGPGLGRPITARQCENCGHIDLFTTQK
ncbi:MAG: hypothetical protein K8I60_03090 [Anaerolineae bacterium]|nr:hypothetical protein [Anaerolineae bacterium]